MQNWQPILDLSNFSFLQHEKKWHHYVEEGVIAQRRVLSCSKNDIIVQRSGGIV